MSEYRPLHQVVILVSNNWHKVEEYRRHFSMYGISVHRLSKETATADLRERLFQKNCHTMVAEGANDTEEATIVEGNISTERRVHKAFVSDETKLTAAGSESLADVSGNLHLQRVSNLCDLEAIIYDRKKGNEVARSYTYRTEGYLDIFKKQESEHVFGWDDIFVPLGLTESFHELKVRGFKVSSRDMCLSNLIQDLLYYTSKDGRLDLAWRPQNYTRTIDFTKRVDVFLRGIPQYNNKYAQKTGVTRLLAHVMDQGVFFRSAENRRTRHYWFPGLNAGIPFTPKPKDPMHELAFMMHDFGHFSIPDLIYTGSTSDFARRVYILFRLCGEATTLSMGDMVFVDTCFKSGFDYETVKRRRIYPLFQQLEKSGIHLDVAEGRAENIHRLLRASARYILCGVTDGYDEILEKGMQAGEKIDREAVVQFTEKYDEYVLADFWWTARNYQEMSKNREDWIEWWANVKDLRNIDGRTPLKMYSVEEFIDFMKAKYPNVSDETEHDELAMMVFETMWSLLLQPLFQEGTEVDLKDANWNVETSFRRWMMGQLMLMVHYRFVPEAKEYQDRIIRTFQSPPDGTDISNSDTIEAIRTHYEQFLDILVNRRLLSLDDRRVFAEVFPVVRPCYINYDVRTDTIVREYILGIMNQNQFGLEA